MKRGYGALLIVLTVTGVSHAHAQPIEEEDLALAYGDKSFVSIATGAAQPIMRAPSVATVITAQDIDAMGARDLDEVLESVPGLHVARSSINYNPVYVIRGIHTDFNPQVLMLLNGIPITMSFTGDRSQVWAGFPVENIARIEVIRGPGSALYGADAFSGVINIITKGAKDLDGTELGVRGGSFDTWDGWLQQPATWGPFESAFYLRAGKTDGHDSTINADLQSTFDGLFGTNASLAPGGVNLGYQAADARLDLSSEHWRIRMSYQGRRDVETATGIASALDTQGHSESDRFLTDVTYRDRNVAPHWDMTVQASYYYISDRSELTVFPAGAAFPGGSFPNGVIGNPEKYERHWRLGTSMLYTGVDKHQLRIGAGWIKDDMYKTGETKNFQIVSLLPSPLGSTVDVSETNPFIRPHDREIKYVYVQDEWSLLKDWHLTAGLRHDDYSDFGSTTNPRIALVWEAAYNVTAKLLYGRAFRAPSFAELYNEQNSNPVATGNPNLKPEKIETTEAALLWQPGKDIHLGFNVFYYHMRDAIRFVANADTTTGSTAQNAGEQTGRGAELEASWDAARSLRLTGNYAYQRSIDESTHRDAGNAPHDQYYLRADWRLFPDWKLNAQFNWIADRKRAANDTRAGVADYKTVDLTLRRHKKSDPWEVSFSVRNLFDADAREPSPSSGLIPNDFPLAGRWYLLQAGYRL